MQNDKREQSKNKINSISIYLKSNIRNKDLKFSVQILIERIFFSFLLHYNQKKFFIYILWLSTKFTLAKTYGSFLKVHCFDKMNNTCKNFDFETNIS